MFYEDNTKWFETLANAFVWILIAAAAAFLIWIACDLITGPRRQRIEVARMLAGIEKAVVENSTTDKASVSSAPITTSPFAPKNKNNKSKGGRHKVGLDN